MKEIEIPFGAKDSELKGFEYTIPEGMEAIIKNGKVTVRKKESEDERIRKELLEEIEFIIPHDDETDNEGLILPSYHARIDRYKSYLEKQKDKKELDFAEGKVEGVKQTCREIKDAMSLFEPKDLTPFESTFRGYVDSAIRYCLSGEGYQQYIKERAADLLNLERQKENQSAEWKPQPESLVALMYAIEGEWEKIKPTSYLSRRLEDLYEGLVNTFNVDVSFLSELPKTAYTAKDIEELRVLKDKIEASMEDPKTKPMDPFNDELQRHQDELYDFKVFAAKQAKEHHISFVHDFEWNNFCAELLSYFNERQKPAEWSEEDEKMRENLLYLMLENNSQDSWEGTYEWLKSLRLKSHTTSIKDATKFGNLEYERGVKDGIQSEKSRHWKPSEEQMEALRKHSSYWRGMTKEVPDIHELETLYADLQKLL